MKTHGAHAAFPGGVLLLGLLGASAVSAGMVHASDSCKTGHIGRGVGSPLRGCAMRYNRGAMWGFIPPRLYEQEAMSS
jgi:hypothetical protein